MARRGDGGALAIRLVTWLVIGGLCAMVIFLVNEAWGLKRAWVLLGPTWQPGTQPPRFGALPLLAGTLWTTCGAALMAVPVSVGAAVFFTEVAPGWLRAAAELALELMSALPSVLLGFLGATVVAPALARALRLPAGYTAATGALVLAVMMIPTVTLVAMAALAAVPITAREASYALGANAWETVCRVVLPAARPGLLAATVLGMGRAAGETMAVLMVTGNVPLLARSPFTPVQTVTAALAGEVGETVRGSQHYHALFALALLLLAVTLALNLAVQRWLGRGRHAPGR